MKKAYLPIAKLPALNNNEWPVAERYDIGKMGILKKLFGGLFSFFGILFGGLVDFVTGPFRSVPGQSAPSQSATSSNSAATAAPAKPKVVVERPFVPNEIPAPRPNRRPGPALDLFRAMAQEIPSARA
ncbi:hypothetical protein [Synechococcus sp. B60.2]|uniref:hypothetical protein n=1 Tax=Synechococcus sp. B60.2 TaxID=2964523 RepID=UPI0039C2876D